jgi:C4-dicarboxylate-specific signal transduction histidine kinase
MANWSAHERLVQVRTARNDGQASLVVIDHGKGLAHIPDGRIFDGAFTSKASGHGIGLALSHRIITRQGGTIEATENPPHGAVFEFTLPLA